MDAPVALQPAGNKSKKVNRQWLMAATIIILSSFFFISSIIQLVYLQKVVHDNPKVDLNQALAGLVTLGNNTPGQQLQAVRLQSLVVLEKAAMENQYHQVNMLLMSRIWISYIGFITGMILSVVGAVFILGKLRVTRSEMSAKISGNEITLKTASPGLLLCLMGTVLMITTMIVNHNIKGAQSAIYITDRDGNRPAVEARTDTIPPLPPPDSLYK